MKKNQNTKIRTNQITKINKDGGSHRYGSTFMYYYVLYHAYSTYILRKQRHGSKKIKKVKKRKQNLLILSKTRS